METGPRDRNREVGTENVVDDILDTTHNWRDGTSWNVTGPDVDTRQERFTDFLRVTPRPSCLSPSSFRQEEVTEGFWRRDPTEEFYETKTKRGINSETRVFSFSYFSLRVFSVHSSPSYSQVRGLIKRQRTPEKSRKVLGGREETCGGKELSEITLLTDEKRWDQSASEVNN